MPRIKDIAPTGLIILKQFDADYVEVGRIVVKEQDPDVDPNWLENFIAGVKPVEPAIGIMAYRQYTGNWLSPIVGPLFI